MDEIAIRTTMLWIHALSGIIWVGASAAFVIAALASAGSGDGGAAFARRVVPRINRLNLAAAVTLIVSGIVNLILAGRLRHFRFSGAFRSIMTVKILILAAMAMAMASSFRAERRLESDDGRTVGGAVRRITRLFGLTVALGGVALGLGLWLLGS